MKQSMFEVMEQRMNSRVRKAMEGVRLIPVVRKMVERLAHRIYMQAVMDTMDDMDRLRRAASPEQSTDRNPRAEV